MKTKKQLLDHVEYLEKLVANFERVLSNGKDFDDFYNHLCEQQAGTHNPKDFRRKTKIALKEARKQLATATKQLEDFLFSKKS